MNFGYIVAFLESMSCHKHHIRCTYHYPNMVDKPYEKNVENVLNILFLYCRWHAWDLVNMKHDHIADEHHY